MKKKEISLTVADSFVKKLLGLMFRRSFSGAFLFQGCRAVHTCFMRFPLDLLFLDADGIVVKKVTGLVPWRFVFGPRKTRSVVESAAERALFDDVHEGDAIADVLSYKEHRMPSSPTRMWIGMCGFLCASLALLAIRYYAEDMSSLHAVWICLASFITPVILLEMLFLRPYVNVSAGIDFASPVSVVSFRRVALKLAALYATLLCAGGIYWLFPVYDSKFYSPYYEMLCNVLPFVIILAIPYFYYIDRYMRDPHDGYWHAGLFLVGKWHMLDRRMFGQYLLGWLVKLFFLPLMYVYLLGKVHYLRTTDFGSLLVFDNAYELSITGLYFVDLLLATAGYMCTFRLCDTHIRSVEYSMLGWCAALECYQPFWSFSFHNYFMYDNAYSWKEWLGAHPTFAIFWGTCIIVLIAVYVCSTVAFGIRFSNLTHRGILTNGPYRLTKHPAYVSKNISWWFISVPFLSTMGLSESIRLSILLLMVNGIYLLRARTEERHLSQDQTYVDYAAYIEEHGIFSWVGKIFPVLRFKRNALFNS